MNNLSESIGVMMVMMVVSSFTGVMMLQTDRAFTQSTAGVMTFSHPNARRQLLEKGIVYTFRKYRHREGKGWAAAFYRGPKIADIDIQVVGRYRPVDLAPFADQSGFASLEEWIKAIQGFKIQPTEYGWLHGVTRLTEYTQRSLPPVEDADIVWGKRKELVQRSEQLLDNLSALSHEYGDYLLFKEKARLGMFPSRQIINEINQQTERWTVEDIRRLIAYEYIRGPR